MVALGQLNFRAYALATTALTIGVVLHAVTGYDGFYPAVMFLTTYAPARATLYNFAVMLLCLLYRGLCAVFIGTLREAEVEQLVESVRHFAADTVLFLLFFAPTIDQRELE